jgi:hypothetical protein
MLLAPMTGGLSLGMGSMFGGGKGGLFGGGESDI